jgi:hypothetical protein
MDNSLKKEVDLTTCRPKNDLEIKALFPSQLDAVKLVVKKLDDDKRDPIAYKGKGERATFNPMWNAQMNDEDIYHAVTPLLTKWQQTNDQAFQSRHDGNPAIRLITITTHIVSCNMKNLRRDCAAPSAWALAETHIYPSYRPRLLTGPSGRVRHIIETRLKPYVRPWNTLTDGRQIVKNTHYQWWDGLTLDESTPSTSIGTFDSVALQADSARLQAQKADDKEIQRLVTLLENSYLSRPIKAPKKTICDKIAGNITTLIKANFGCPSSPLPFHSSTLFQSFEELAERNRIQRYHHGKDPIPDFEVETTHRGKYIRAGTVDVNDLMDTVRVNIVYF